MVGIAAILGLAAHNRTVVGSNIPISMPKTTTSTTSSNVLHHKGHTTSFPLHSPILSSINNDDSSSFAPIYTAAALADEVTALPGLPASAPTFRQFAGYLDITPTKHIFYWYVEPDGSSTGVDPATAPLSLWTNGGPGCSGLFGFLAENGPYRPTKGGAELEWNSMSWNTLSHMVYVEIPVGVGFSYSDDKAEYHIGDTQTARDNYLVLQEFYRKFPHLRGLDLYLTSESYGGHYIPTLAQEIVLENQALLSSSNVTSSSGRSSSKNMKGSKLERDKMGTTRTEEEAAALKVPPPPQPKHDKYINLKGFAIGNPFTDPVENMVGMIDALNGHDVIPESLYERWLATCEAKGAAMADVFYSHPCRLLEQEMWHEVGQGIDPYALDWPVCKDDVKMKGRNQRHALLEYLVRLDREDESMAGAAEISEAGGNFAMRAAWDHDKHGLPFEPCEDDYLSLYLNRADVKAALHAKEDIKWKDCTNKVKYFGLDQDVYIEPVYRFLMDENRDLGLRVLLFSGDDDSVCGPRGTEMWLRSMGWKVTEQWKAWVVEGEVAGYMKTYENGLVFATVLGAGHEVPAFTPQAAWFLFRSYLEGDVERLRME